MAAFSHNGEPGSALDAELKGHDTRHREGYAAGFKAGREAGMREAVSIIRREQTEMTDPVFWATAILSAIGGGK